MKLKIASYFATILLFANPAYASWTNWMKITDNYFEGTGTSTRLVLIMEQPFHTCGWNNAAQIQLDQIGSEAYKTLVSVAITAITTGRALSLAEEGCNGDRARIYGLKLGG
jgi:hypothetical protein